MRTISAALAALAALTTTAAAGPTAREPALDDGAATAIEPTSADDWLRLGLSRYESGDFRGAVDAFRAGHALEPRAAFLFAIAQAERRSGDCAAAVVYYTQFLATSPAEEQAVAAREQRDRCEQALGAAPAAGSGPTPPPVTTEPADDAAAIPTPAATPTPPATAHPRNAPAWWRDPITLGTGGGAVALTLTGVALLVLADSAADDASTAATYDQHVTLGARAESRNTAGLVTLSVGLAFGGYTAYRLITRPRARDARTERRAHVAPGPGIGLAVVGSF